MNGKLLFLLNPSIIRDLAKTYEWATGLQKDYDSLPGKERRDVSAYRVNWNYKEIALDLVNKRYSDQLRLLDMCSLTWNDLERSYYISKLEVPKDRMGIIYMWLHTHIHLLVNDKNVVYTVSTLNVNTLDDYLYHKFMITVKGMTLIETGIDTTKILKRSKDSAFDPRELESIFKDILAIIIHYNISLRGLYTTIERRLRDSNA